MGLCVSIHTIPSEKGGEDREKWRLFKHPNVQCVGLNNSATWNGAIPFPGRSVKGTVKLGSRQGSERSCSVSFVKLHRGLDQVCQS